MQIVKRRGAEVGVGGAVAVTASWVSTWVLSASLEVGVGRSPPSDVQPTSKDTRISILAKNISLP